MAFLYLRNGGTLVAKSPIKKKCKPNHKPNHKLDCQGVKLESGKVGKITFLQKDYEPPMLPLGDLGKW